MLNSRCQQIWKTHQWPQDWKRSVLIPIPEKGNARECSNCCTIVLISHVSKFMFKILQATLQQYVNWELPDEQAEFRKGRGTRDQIANIRWINRESKEFQRNIYFCFTHYATALTVWITTNCEKFFKRWEYQTTLPARNEVEPDMEKLTGSKFGKEYIKVVYCHPAYLTYVQSKSCEMLGWTKRSWNQDCWEKYQSPQLCRWHHPYGRAK